MRTKDLLVTSALAVALGLMLQSSLAAQQRKPDRPGPDKAAGDPDRGKPAAKQPADADLDGPPAKPPRDGDGDGPPRKPPRDQGFDGPPPPEGEGQPGPGRKPPRDGDMDRPPPGDREGPPGPDRRPPQGPPGPPRWPHQDWGSMEKNDPEMFKLMKQDMDLERQTRELADSYRQTPAAKRDDLKKQVEKLVGQQFEVRQQRRQLELKRLEEDLQRLRDAIERRTKARKDIVEKRVAELLGQQDDAGF